MLAYVPHSDLYICFLCMHIKTTGMSWKLLLSKLAIDDSFLLDRVILPFKKNCI